MNKKYLITRIIFYYGIGSETDSTPIIVPSVTKYKTELYKSHPDAVRIWFDYDVLETIQIKK